MTAEASTPAGQEERGKSPTDVNATYPHRAYKTGGLLTWSGLNESDVEHRLINAGRTNCVRERTIAMTDTQAKHARVTVFANHKGGVGKTWLLMVMAAELAMRGHKVLVVDLDPQANASRRLGYAEHELENRPTIAEAVAESSPDVTRSALLPCQWEPDWADNITLLPSRIELENRVSEAGVPGSWMRLDEALSPLLDQYHYVLIDTQPTLGHLLHLALVIADDVITPAAPEYDAVRGATRLMEFVASPKNRRSLGINAELIGVVLNAKRSGVATHEARVTKSINQWGDLVWQPPLPLRARFHDTQEFAEPPHSAAGEAGTVIRDAAKQLVDRYLSKAA